MALRTLVTGSDMCTGSDGAGPSNAVGALVHQLLGGASKTQEQLRDVSVCTAGLVQHAVHALHFSCCHALFSSVFITTIV
jgi:peroxin-5